MSSIRLLPIVVVAITALLVLKGIGLITQGGYVLLGTGSVMAQATPADAGPADDGVELSANEEAAAARAADSLFATSTAQTPEETGPGDGSDGANGANGADGANGTDGADPETGAQSGLSGVSATEQAVLRRLSERRVELDARAGELELRVSLVQAAEARLEERMAELVALEARVKALVEAQNSQGDQVFAGLVSMYENMKPNDAAAVFDTLDINVLLRLATSINPRKMSPILAKMSRERAQVLTVRMAAPPVNIASINPSANAGSQANSALPQIVGQ